MIYESNGCTFFFVSSAAFTVLICLIFIQSGVDSARANAVLAHLRSQFASLPGTAFGGYTVATADEFTYLDPVDQSISRNQGGWCGVTVMLCCTSVMLILIGIRRHIRMGNKVIV